MKSTQVLNSQESKSGKSINFYSGGNKYSIKKKVLLENMEISKFEGCVIEITESRIMNGWVMIDEFRFINRAKKKKFDFSSVSNNMTIDGIKLNENEMGTFEEVIQNKIMKLEPFSPFEILGSSFSSSNTGVHYKISYVSKLKLIKEENNSYASVLQNIFSRGKNIRTWNSKFDDISLNVILDMYKRGYKVDDITVMVPFKLEEMYKKAKLELDEMLDIFMKIAHDFPHLEIRDFVKNVKVQFYDKNQISIVDNNTSDIILEMTILEKKNNALPMTFISNTNITYNKFVNFPNEINKLLKLVFYNERSKIEKLKIEQMSALELLLNGKENILAVLKTGFGKSLIYQFASVLQPRVFINVFPINALISDQTISLENEFNLSYIVDNHALKTIKEKNLYRNLLSTKRMFMITPERLENKMMQNYFESLHNMIGYMIFDEAHCISEWGHDFRQAYLMARHLMENLIKSTHFNVVALTATAAPHIQKDIARLLSISRNNIINIANTSGLKRSEITYRIIKEDVDDFDIWNRSEEYSQIIDQYIEESYYDSKQGIVFFMKKGSNQDLEKNKYLKKINAFSAFKRNNNLTNIGLYTGGQKQIGKDERQISPSNFGMFTKLKYIFATKSFGMGINLIDCDYVLLAEPPYSLEDLYQQSGRVGRRGQDSIVEILYHNRSLINPLDNNSPYNFFLKIDSKRIENQPLVIWRLIKIIYETNKPFTLRTNSFFEKNNKDNQALLKWAISHLITEFRVIKKYYVKYGFNFNISEVTIFPHDILTLDDLINKINNKNKNLGMGTEGNDLLAALKIFYNYYFDKLQNDKIIGINIFRDKLMHVDASNAEGNEIISQSLTDYYKTRMDKVEVVAGEIIQKMRDSESLINIIDFINISAKDLSNFELMESISRFSINTSFIEVASLLLYYLLNEKILISSVDIIIKKNYDNKYLNNTKNEIIFKMIESYDNQNKEWLKIKPELVRSPKWSKIIELNEMKKIMEELNGRNK